MSLAGDLDLVVGNLDGELNYIENTGNSTAPVFVRRTGTANPFDGIDVERTSSPALGDLDGDGALRPRPSTDKLRLHNFVSLAGDLDLVVGTNVDSLIYAENTGTSTAPVFVQRTGSANPLDGVEMSTSVDCAPALGDLDGDGMLRPCPSIDKL